MSVIPSNANFNSALYPLIGVVVTMIVIGFGAAILYRQLFRRLPATMYDFGLKVVLVVGTLFGLYLGLKIVGA